MTRLLPPALLLISLILMPVLDRLLPLAQLFHPPWTGLGVLPAAAGVTIAIAGRLAFRRAGTEINTFRQPGSLVTGGVFRLSRNPMYLGMALLLLGAAIGYGSLSPLLLAAVFVVIADRWYIRFEEAAMTKTFGDDYRAYRKRVGRWL
jgi:protein-S-isoprenylcysteine O-methyltransferase Ste14